MSAVQNIMTKAIKEKKVSGQVFSNKRPGWCPYPECEFLMNSQNRICTGKLKKVTTDGHWNTHRFCLDERETGHGIHDLQINSGDAWHMVRHLIRIYENG